MLRLPISEMEYAHPMRYGLMPVEPEAERRKAVKRSGWKSGIDGVVEMERNAGSEAERNEPMRRNYGMQ